ncbi:type II 3-dehydroquinate dehydratase [Corynebacterium sp. 320]|uniref:3-dehydroquinate dehydratase n=1 Tax=Corynebacterium zhongnanshanii TaxID=2768834 RepID=A0ABQ6VGA7_9CORY|nr:MULTISPECIES: type II 3-dehydroquinate dehydratase [Corynebacterium]KAB1503705.1 type II 3-dehydroquinate dehydratase [Corynebacterium sp. 320]KAB1553194.1 type II 3-dehydroquinate dehydratase [Corynebacterium sp. 321]KAB1553587.1 type II 3-dehydroquinate dehydratase [Corynebacterium sp. 319]KAB3523444.1 type II 3-dehydroquinate dehydratase [Corynebacterium zhongnanshanii]KAB3527841.1 type II 3-dehydroquinate dehydratase [Corynebacterium sp. 250]
MLNIVVINGPNLNRLGKRQPDVYGSTTLQDIEADVANLASELGVHVEFFQSNYEGALLERIHQAADDGAGVVINPGAFTHTSVALRDALAEIADGLGFVEVHISNVHAREPFRHHSYLSDIARGVIAGLGTYGYSAAVRYFAEMEG